MRVVILNASERFKSNLNTFGFNYEASVNEAGLFDIVVYPGQLNVDDSGVVLKTVDGYSGYVIKMLYTEFSTMIID